MPISIPSNTLEKFTTFGDLLRFLRRRVGLNQIELANAVGYSNTQISRLEQNLRLPDISVIQSHFISALGLEDEPKAVARLLDLAANVRREDAPTLGLCPYKGLNYFDETDADLFVGREALSARLVERVFALTVRGSVQKTRLLAIVGASGSGKSSLVRAGLVPALRWNKETVDWHIHVLTPTAHPLESLATTLTQETNSVTTAANLMNDLGYDSRSLQVFAHEKISLRNGGRLLLVVDQFEELFALCHSDEERAAFIDNLLTAASETSGPVMIVIALRADFYAACASYPQLREALATSQVYIGTMNDDEIRRAIETPAQRGHWEFEPGLVELLLHDVGHEPGALPLLSHALFETWQRRRGPTMTLSGYASSGGVRGAIAETAETVFADQFTNEQRAIARRIFLRLTELSDEATTADTRRRASFNELILKPAEASTAREVLKVLADARLITTTEDAAEVAHEALIREWPTLRHWLEENRESLRLHRQLTEAAQEWQKLDRTPDLLYRGARLAQAGEWIATHQDEINELEREFLTASIEAWEHETREREEGRQRELASAKELAETQRQSASRLRTRNRVITAVGFLAVILAMLAGIFGLQSRNEKRVAISRELSSAAIRSLDVDPELGILLALQALDTVYTREAEDALHRAIQASRVRMTLTGHTGGAHSVDYSPDGKTIAVTSESWEVIVWETASGQELFRAPGSIALYSPNGERLATGGLDGIVTVWDLATWKKLLTMEGHNNRIVDLAFSPDGKLLVSVGEDDRLIVWDAETGDEEFSSDAHVFGFEFRGFGRERATFSADGKLLIGLDTGMITSKLLFWAIDHDWALLQQPGDELMIFSPDGRWLVSWDSVQEGPTGPTNTKGMALWDISKVNLSSSDLWSLEPFVVPEAHDFSIIDFDFSQDGSMLASISEEGIAKVWHLSSTGPELLMTLSGHTQALTDVAFSSDGTRLATTSLDGTVRLWDITTPAGVSEWFAIAGHRENIHRLALTQDGKYFATASVDGSAKVWELASGKELLAIPSRDGPYGSLFDVAISPDGKRLATAGYNNIAEIWQLNLTSGAATAELLQRFTGDFDQIPVGYVDYATISVVFSPDGTKIAAGGMAGIAKIWDVENGQELFSVRPITGVPGISQLAFSPDSHLLAIAGEGSDALAKIWIRDVASGKEISTLSGHDVMFDVESMVFSPDGERIATSLGDGSVKIWETKTGDELLDLVGHTAPVIGVDFSPDGRYLATVSPDGTVRKWDAYSGQELVVYRSPGGPLFDVKITPDGKRIIASGAGYIYGYVFDLDETIRLARSRLTRWFTPEECRKYLHREVCPVP